MKYPDNIKAVAACGVDYMGFIFYEKSKRFVGDDFNLDVELLENKSLKRVGVFVNQPNTLIEQKAALFRLDYIQLHGDESVEQCRTLKEKGYSIIKAFQVNATFDFEVTKAYKKYADFFLFDTKSDGFGGTGKTYDWSILKNYDNEVPLFLSGGLGPDSIEEINKIKGVNIAVLDLNSKFELEPGLKDVSLIEKFIKLIK